MWFGAIQVLRNAFFLGIRPPPTPSYAKNVEPYTFSGKADMPHPQLHYVTLEWPLFFKIFIFKGPGYDDRKMEPTRGILISC